MAKKSDLQTYREEYERWLPKLTNYQNRFKENYKRYSGYFDEVGTDVQVADPVAFELVERVVQRLFEQEPKFFADSSGFNLPREIRKILTATSEFIWDNGPIISASGPMRNKLKVVGREFCITGNVGIETYWNNVADAPDFRVIPVEDVVFDPSKTLRTSPVYYIRQFVSLDYLKDNVEVKKDGEVVTGIFKSAAIKQLSREDINHEKPDPSNVYINRTGTDVQRWVDEYELISRWEKGHCVRFIKGRDQEDPILVQEFDSLLDDDPLDFAMDVEVVKEPYAMSIIDPQAGLFKAKDLILSQTVDYGAKVLNPPTIVNPAIGNINLKSVANMYKLGGIVLADPTQIRQELISNAPQAAGLDMMNYIEQRAESISGVGAYLAGISNQPSDKTQGTAAGIQALQNAGIAPITDRQLNIEESIIQPFINKALQMIGATMSKNDFKWVLVGGEDQKWVKVTKGLLTGKIKLIDLMQAEVIQDTEAQAIVQVMLNEGKDPKEDILFDVDWVIGVEAGSMAQSDVNEAIKNKTSLVDLAAQLFIPIDREKLWLEIAQDSGIKEPDQYILQGQNASTGMPPASRRMTENMNFADLPPDGKMQMAANAGIQLNPQDMQQPGQQPASTGGAPANPQGQQSNPLAQDGVNLSPGEISRLQQDPRFAQQPPQQPPQATQMPPQAPQMPQIDPNAQGPVAAQQSAAQMPIVPMGPINKVKTKKKGK